MDREVIKSIIEKQKVVLATALAKGLGSPDTRVDEVIAENAQETITALQNLLELPMHPDPEINKEVNADILEGEAIDMAVGLPPQKFKEIDENWLPTTSNINELPLPVKTFIHDILDAEFQDNWLPTPENVNKLPEPLRRYIHDIETKCDPAGHIQQLAFLKDTIKGLEKTVEEQKEMFSNWTPTPENILELPDSVREFVNKMQIQIVDIGQKDSIRTKEHNGLVVENRKLHDSIKKHHDQKGDDRCWLDDAELYTAAGLDDGNSALPKLPEFIGNCVRFHQSRQNPKSKYLTVEKQIEKAVAKAAPLMRRTKNLLKQVLQYHGNRKGISRFLVEDIEKAVEKMEKLV